jgi:hypothetical protein
MVFELVSAPPATRSRESCESSPSRDDESDVCFGVLGFMDLNLGLDVDLDMASPRFAEETQEHRDVPVEPIVVVWFI